MFQNYQVTLTKNSDYDLEISYNETFKGMSDDDMAIALEDCIRSLQIELMSLTNQP
jgi:hypothetical protein